jgi:hypothetical protein
MRDPHFALTMVIAPADALPVLHGISFLDLNGQAIIAFGPETRKRIERITNQKVGPVSSKQANLQS